MIVSHSELDNRMAPSALTQECKHNLQDRKGPAADVRAIIIYWIHKASSWNCWHARAPRVEIQLPSQIWICVGQY